MDQTKHIYRFSLDCGRMGEINSIFVSTPADIEDLAGEKIYFGEVLGKHSDIVCTADPSQFQAITADTLTISLFEQHELETGLNPFDYVEDEPA